MIIVSDWKLGISGEEEVAVALFQLLDIGENSAPLSLSIIVTDSDFFFQHFIPEKERSQG